VQPAQLQDAGWQPLATSGFTEDVGPFWIRGVAATREVGFIAEPRHSNRHIGTVHGGVLMSFADVALGIGAIDALENQTHCVTVQLQLQFVSTGKIGEFLVCRPELIRRASQLVFMRGLIVAGERIVANADGIWKLLMSP
jgi:acyl-coenzyme A thioesterase PaaI-like protein